MLRQLLSICMFLLALMNVACASSGKPINIKLHVVGNDSQPIADVNVVMNFLLSHGGNIVKGKTDNNGFVEITENGIFGVSIDALKEGFYRSVFRTGYGDQELTLILREKKNPVAMYAKKVRIIAPELVSEFGYDLIKGDYVKPYGEGVVSDLLFKVVRKEKDFWNYDYHLSISFSNPGDGLHPFFFDHLESRYKSSYLAPFSEYKNKWDFKRIARRGKLDNTNFDKKRNYYLRVRTIFDSEGKVESAYYGKIYGEFPDMMYYLNPELNDRNVEFSGVSLFKNLDHSEQVTQL